MILIGSKTSPIRVRLDVLLDDQPGPQIIIIIIVKPGEIRVMSKGS